MIRAWEKQQKINLGSKSGFKNTIHSNLASFMGYTKPRRFRVLDSTKIEKNRSIAAELGAMPCILAAKLAVAIGKLFKLVRI